MDITAYTDDERLPNIKGVLFSPSARHRGAGWQLLRLPDSGYSSYGSTNGYGLAIRQDWLKEANLEMPRPSTTWIRFWPPSRRKNPSADPLIGRGRRQWRLHLHRFARLLRVRHGLVDR